MMEGLQISIPHRMKLLRTVLVLSLLTSLFLSIHLWAGARKFPYTPWLFSFRIEPPYDYVYLILLTFLCFATLFLRKQRLFLFFIVLFCAWLVICDLTRLQPWLYTYLALLVVFIFYSGRVDDSNKFTSYFIILQIVAASVYFYTGLNQMNNNFVDSEFIQLIAPMREMMSERQFLLFAGMGHAVPYILAGLGVGLMIPSIRFLAVALAIVMHFFLLLFLFPSSKNMNYALWFSNLVFILVLLLLFSGKTKQRYFSPTFLIQMPLFYAILFLFVLAPAFNRWGNWPDFLSSNFRTGNTNTALILFSERVYDKLPEFEQQFVLYSGNGYILNYQDWCLSELNSECFPDKKVFNSLFSHIVELNGGDVKEIELKYLPHAGLLRKP